MNIQGLVNNFASLSILIDKMKPNLIFLTETHIKDTIYDVEIDLKGYNCIRCDTSSSHTGGVIIYVKNFINFSIISTVADVMNHNYFLAIKTYYEQQMKIYGVIYHSPSSNDLVFLDSFENWMEEMVIGEKNITICGDFNIDLKKVNSISERVKNIVLLNGCKQIVKDFTRITERSRTLIDYVITNDSEWEINISSENKISDHESIVLKKSINCDEKVEKVKIRCWKNYNCAKLSKELTFQLNWNELLYADLNNQTLIINSALKRSISELVKIKEIPLRNSKNKWFSNELKLLKSKCVTLHVIAKNSRSIEDWSNYKGLRNFYVKKINEAKNDSISNEIEMVKDDSKKMWKTIKELLQQKPKCPEQINFEGILTSDPKEISEKFNLYFIKSITDINKSIVCVDLPVIFNNYIPNSTFQFERIDLQLLMKFVNSFKKSGGLYNINKQVLLDSMEIIGVPLVNIINESLQSGVFPDCFKNSVITPIQKVSRTKLCTEFRPINELETPEKLMEMIVKEQLMDYINKNNILIKEQSGFREKHSCESALNLVVHDWSQTIENGEVIISVFLDLKRAFETIDRKLLITKLECYGVEQNSLKWFESYLNNRTQQVNYNGEVSSKLHNNIGVPQGSILGPVLFALYINDLRDVVKHSTLNLFADDTLISVSARSTQEAADKINDDLTNVSKWLKLNKLKLNIEKTKCMVINSRSEINVNIKVENSVIEVVDSYKYLGVILDNKFDFKENIKYVCKKMSKKVGLLGRLRNKLPFNSAVLIYKTIISPHVDYCASMLFMCNKTEMDKLQKVQNRCLRVILRCNRRTSIKLMLNTLCLLSIKQRIFYNTLVLIFKITNNLLPEYLKQKIKYNYEVATRSLRRQSQLNVPNLRKEKTRRSIFYNGIKLFNELPSQIRKSEKLNEFKRKCVKYVKENF